ncbi:MAG: alpha-hydroxy-acid oxidizing protein [Candidatus Methanoperedens sp.]|nr:alpha-hydroxy-acid oxidizing protein [Candidatus Methanoperedens sp.]
MAKWLCAVCNIYVYNEETGDSHTGIDPNTKVPDFPDFWRCPVCGANKDKLVPILEEEYWQKARTYTNFTEKKEEKRNILVGVDNPLTVPELRQEYGTPLGLRGIGQGLTCLANFSALSKYRLKKRLISKHEDPVIETAFLGKKINMPVLGAPMSGLSYVSNITEEDFAYNILEGCKAAGTVGCTGNTSRDYEMVHPAIMALKKVNGHGINIFKPQSQEVLIDLIKQSEVEKAVAVGVDIDGAGSVNFSLAGKPVFRKTIDELKELKIATRLPFIVKGVMCLEDAMGAAEAGADVIGVSNHGGRVLDSDFGVADVLPEIVKGLRDTDKDERILITADGGVRTGFDVIKMLALGADYVLMGRPLAREAVSNGVEGVKRVLEYIQTDIRIAMLMTSCNTLEDIKDTILIRDR